jgi:hypothetical protein
MAIKSKVELKKREDIQYPVIMIGKLTGVVVLFIEDRVGYVLHTGESGNSCGYYSDGWLQNEFKKFEGEITLSND